MLGSPSELKHLFCLVVKECTMLTKRLTTIMVPIFLRLCGFKHGICFTNVLPITTLLRRYSTAFTANILQSFLNLNTLTVSSLKFIAAQQSSTTGFMKFDY